MRTAAYRRRRWISCTMIAAALTLTVAACGSSSGSSGSGGGSGSYMSSAQMASLQKIVDGATAVPTFSVPGPSFDASKAKGTKIMAIPTASQLPVCEQIAHDVVGIAGNMGMSGKVFDNSGGASGWIPGIQQAISQHYNAIALICGIDPDLIKPQLEAAKKAGIAVIDSGLLDSTVQGSQVSPLVTTQTNIPNYLSMQQSIAYMLLQNKAKPFDIFEIKSNDVPAGIVMDQAIRKEVGQYCPKCGIRSTNIPVPNWATDVQPAVASGLQSDPNIKAVVPIFDGEVPPAAAVVRAANKPDVKLYGDYGGTPEYIDQMGKGSIPMGDDVGPTHLWRAYATMDQVLRVLTHTTPLPPNKDSDPSRLFTPQNYKAVNAVNGGFGSAFVAGYKKLWGVG
jgi:ribose transport system substrate-binding protein